MGYFYATVLHTTVTAQTRFIWVHATIVILVE